MVEPITTAILQVLVEEVCNSLKIESNFLHGFKSQLDVLKNKLMLMNFFLTELCGLKRNHHGYHTVKKILDNMRELIYDADDLLIDCQIQDDYLKEAYHHRFSPRASIFRHKKGRKLQKINEQIEQLEKQLVAYLAPIRGEMSQRSSEEGSSNTRWTSKAFDQSKVIGLQEDTRKVLKWILQKNEVQNQVGIVGMGGLGKTTIARKIFHDKQVVKHFEKRIWVSVSQKVDEIVIMRSMLKQLGEDESGSCRGVLLDRIQQALEDKTCLIVMDDVWSIDDWWVQLSGVLPKQKKCTCSIILTTRNDEVARSMGVMEGRIHRPKVLDENESWVLFCDVAFSPSKHLHTNSYFEEVGKEILKKCGGLPLAIKAIGGLLSTKAQSLSAWKEINNDFRDKLVDEELYSVNASLQLSYDALPAHLKHCILSFSIYPEDFEINAEQLVYWWIGEGFITGNDTKTALELAFRCLSELISRCLVEVVNQRGYDGFVYSCKMHDMIRDLIIIKAKEEAFCIFDNNDKPKPDTHSRHLSFISEMDDKPLERNSKLRALLVTKSSPFHLYWKTGLATVRSLRVLDLAFNKLNGVCVETLLDWIKSQNRLTYLNLRGVSMLKDIQNSIKNLRNLRLLVLAECNNLEKLPTSITALHKLTVLDVGNCPSLRNLPPELGKLTNLQVLSGFKFASPGTDGCRFGELKGLTELRVLRMSISGKDEIANDEWEVLSLLKKLKVLSIDTKECEKKTILQKLDKLSPPPCLQELYLRYYHGDATPKWINPYSLPELLYLYIENGELACLSHDFCGNKEKPWKIEGLCLKYLPRLQVQWETLQIIMPLLRYVEVSHCHMLQSFPIEVDYVGVWKKQDEEESEDGVAEVAINQLQQ